MVENKLDLICKGFNIKMLKDFLSAKGTKENGKTACYSTIRNCFDYTPHGSKEPKEPLSPSVCVETDIYLMSFKKRVANAK